MLVGWGTWRVWKGRSGGSIDGWKVEDFVVKGYNPHKAIAMKMSV